MRRTTALLCVLMFGFLPLSASAEVPDVVTSEVSFSVVNPLEPGETLSVSGSLVRAAGEPCGDSVMLLTHGLSYGRWAWDFPVETDTYSTARTLARAGYPAVTIDKLGYGNPDDHDGHRLTVQSYAAITDQIVRALRTGAYTGDDQTAFEKVGLMGHSAGTEISELAAGLYGSADVLVATGYTHFPSQQIVEDFVTSEIPRALQDDYIYFGETEEHRMGHMYHAAGADEHIMDADLELANLTPSGEILSISNQPSRWAIGLIDVPVLLVLGEHDTIFPVENGPDELVLFASSPDRSLQVVEDAGHTWMLHRAGPPANEAVVDWLDGRDALPSCAA